MYLLDRMERGTPQRKTVYRISLTLVKRESLDDDGGGSQQAENPKVGACRREGSVEVQRSALLEQLKEVEDESDDLSSHGFMRSFRTFSTGQLELGRMKVSRKLQKELKAGDPLAERGREAPGKGPEAPGKGPETPGNGPEAPGKGPEAPGNGPETPGKGPEQEAGHPGWIKGDVCSAVEKKKRLLKARSMEERSSEPPVNGDGTPSHSRSNGKPSKAASPETPPLKTGLLRRSFSFRHWSGGDLLRLRALSKDKHHSSSGCIGQAASATPEPPAPRLLDPPREKSRTLEVGAVLNKTDSMTELSRWESARGSKNRTLDNSDLQRLAAERDAAGGGFLLRGGGGRSSERRLVRFFSGIFLRRDGASPLGSPSTGRSLRRCRGPALSQSSSESVNGGSTEGKHTHTQLKTHPNIRVAG